MNHRNKLPLCKFGLSRHGHGAGALAVTAATAAVGIFPSARRFGGQEPRVGVWLVSDSQVLAASPARVSLYG